MVSAETPSKSPKRARAPTPSVPRWKAEEEERLRALVKELGTKGTWSTIAERLETGRSKSAVEQHWAILTGKRKPSTPKKAAGVGSSAAPQVAPKADAAADSRFWQSIRIYFACVGGLFTLLAVILRYAPEAEADVCDEVGVSSFLGSNKTQGVIDLWKCATAYQKSNSLFVLGMFELTYIGLKMFAIPAAFTLCVLSGAIFPIWQAQLLTGVGEAVGSSFCYLLSDAIARPIVERLFAAKLTMLQERAEAERDHMLLFNFFLRLSPAAPNWFINVASPIIGIPLKPFFIASLIGTQVTLTFQCGAGATLRDLGESGFDLGPEFRKKGFLLVAFMGLVQMIPLALIRHQKRLKAAAEQQAQKLN